MAKTRHYRKRTTRRHNKRTRKHKRGGSSPPRKSRGTVGRTDMSELSLKEYYNFGNGNQKEYQVNPHGQGNAHKGATKSTRIANNPFDKEFKP